MGQIKKARNVGASNKDGQRHCLQAKSKTTGGRLRRKLISKKKKQEEKEEISIGTRQQTAGGHEPRWRASTGGKWEHHPKRGKGNSAGTEHKKKKTGLSKGKNPR